MTHGFLPHFLYALFLRQQAGLVSRLFVLPGYWPFSFLLTNDSNTYSQCTEGFFPQTNPLKLLKIIPNLWGVQELLANQI